MSKKPQRRVFAPDTFSTDIGGKEYIITPQPLKQILEFDDVIAELSQQFDDLSDTHYVIDDETGDEVAGPFETYDDAQAYIEAEKLEGKSIDTQGVPVRDVLDRLISSPFVVLKPLIPELTEEHAREMSFPQLKFLFGLLIEVNGLEWFEEMTKNVLEPLLPKLSDITAGAFIQGMQGALSGFTGTQEEPSGETPSTDS